MSYPVYIDNLSGASKGQTSSVNNIVNNSYKTFIDRTTPIDADETKVKQVVNRNTVSNLVAGLLDFNYLFFNTVAFTLRTDFDWEQDAEGNFSYYELFELWPGADLKIDQLSLPSDIISFTGVNSNTAITQLLTSYCFIEIRWKPSSQTYAVYIKAMSQPPKTTWGVYCNFLYTL